MKELSIEQKAERYDEISKEVKDFFDGKQKMYSDVEQTLNHLFPELKESDDERMWKLIKKYVHYNISDMALNADHMTREQLESWLEKQGTSYTKKDVDNAYLEGISVAKNEIEKQCEPNATSINKEKPTWTEEDESVKQWIISDIEKLFSLNKKSDIISKIEIDWLKSLKKRIGG